MWAQAINMVLGIWVMASPAVLHYNQTVSNNNHIVGPLIITFAVVALWDINRNVRFVNVLLGVWLIASVFILPAQSYTSMLSNGVAGLAIVLFSLVKRKTNDAYGGGWRSLFQKHPLHLQEAERQSSL